MNFRFQSSYIVVLIVGLFSLSLVLSACSENNQQQLSGSTMGTTYSITIVGEQIIAPEDVTTALETIDASMSTYRDDSELMQLNQAALNTWLPVSAPLYEVLRLSEEINQLSGGAFDITVAPLVNLWGFGPASNSPATLPAEELITSLLDNVGFQYLRLDPEQQAVMLTRAVALDLSAIAKGYAVDLLAELLEAHSIANYLVEIGGEIRSAGLNANKQPWRIAIEHPQTLGRSVQKIIQIEDASMATSGDYRNFFELDGVTYSHTIDPRNGYPITHALASVTVISDSTAKADALATAFSVLGEQAAMALANEHNIAAYFLIKTTDGFTESYSAAFSDFLMD